MLRAQALEVGKQVAQRARTIAAGDEPRGRIDRLNERPVFVEQARDALDECDRFGIVQVRDDVLERPALRVRSQHDVVRQAVE